METVPIADFTYDLPDDRIARFPLAERDQSRLLVYRGGAIRHGHFTDLPDELPEGSLLVFNNTKVIPARLFFRKQTGALIELFLLHPVEPTPVIQLAMEVSGSAVWECLIGNRKRWKGGEILVSEIPDGGGSFPLSAQQVDDTHVRLSWDAALPFAEVVQRAGKIPLPPYLDREAEESDLTTYQTVYSEKKGAVAAPTAGLHFTDRVFAALAERGVGTEFLTLHVGAGTFQPVKTENALEHRMHGEQIVVRAANLRKLIAETCIIAVGTTSLRTLESLYWLGVQLLSGELAGLSDGFYIEQFVHRKERGALPTYPDAFRAILSHLEAAGREEVTGETGIMIYPGYTFRVIKGLVTNFHQPGSTLMLLVAALVGDDWKRIYSEALEGNYRFLSYGDSSLLWPSGTIFNQ